MIFLKVVNSYVAESDTSDIISKNAVRANELFITFTGYTTTYSDAATKYICRLTFERADGVKVQDLATQVKTYTHTNPSTNESVVYYGYGFNFPDISVTAVPGVLKLSAKLIRYTSAGTEQVIVSCNTNLNVVDNATESTANPNISESVYNSLLAAINAINQPIVKLTAVGSTAVDFCNQLKTSSAAKGLYTNGEASDLYYYNGSDTCTLIGPGKFTMYKYVGSTFVPANEIENDTTFKNKVTAKELIAEEKATIGSVSKKNDSDYLLNVYLFSYFYSKIYARTGIVVGDDVSSSSSYSLLVKKGKARVVYDLEVNGNATLYGSNRLGQVSIDNEDYDNNTTEMLTAYPVNYVPYLMNNTAQGTADMYFVTKEKFTELMASWIGTATSSKNGLLAKEDKDKLDALYAVLGEETGDDDQFVNKIRELLAIFNQYPEGASIVDALASKVDKTTYDTKMESLDGSISSLSQNKANKSYCDSTYETKTDATIKNGALGDRVGAVEEELENVQNRIDNSQPLVIESRVSTLESKVSTLESKIVNDKEIEGIVNALSTPSNIMPYAELKSVGGMCYKSKNLLNIADKVATTTNGVTYSITNGVITINGTATAETNIWIPFDEIVSGNYSLKLFKSFSGFDMYLMKGNGTWSNFVSINKNGINENMTLDYSYKCLLLNNFNTSVTFNNLKLKPMLVRGSTAPTTFRPYYSSIRCNSVVGLNVKGANLCYMKDKSQSVSAWGYASGSLEQGVKLKKGTYTLSFDNVGTSGINKIFYNSSNLISSPYIITQTRISATFTLTQDTTITNFDMQVISSGTFAIKNVMLNEGSVALDYVPYTQHTALANIFESENLYPYSGTYTASANAKVWLGEQFLLKKGTYSYSFNVTNENGITAYQIRNMDTDSNIVSKDYPRYNTATFTLTEDTNIKMSAWSTEATTIKIEAMLVRGSVAPSVYKPFTTETIGNRVRAKGYELGLGLSSSCFNLVDLQNKKVVVKCAKVDLGSLTWEYRTSEDKNRYIATINGIKKVTSTTLSFNGLCANYSIVDNENGWANYTKGNMFLTANSEILVVLDSTTPSGTLIYELATPIEIDVSDILTDDLANIFEAQKNGSIELIFDDNSIDFDNEVYLNLDYQTKGDDSTSCSIIATDNSSNNVSTLALDDDGTAVASE